MKLAILLFLLTLFYLGALNFLSMPDSPSIVLNEKNVSQKSVQMFWFRKIGLENEEISEVWLSFAIPRDVRSKVQEIADSSFPISKRSFGSFLKSFNPKEEIVDTKELDKNFILKVLLRRKEIVNKIPANFPTEFRKFVQEGRHCGGSIGHGPHDILVLVKCKLVLLLINSQDNRFLDEVNSEFFSIQSSCGFCSWSYCGNMLPFQYYENMFCSSCLSKTTLPPYEQIHWIMPENIEIFCPKCQKKILPKLLNEPTSSFFKHNSK